MGLKITTSETGPPNVLFEKEDTPVRDFFEGLGEVKRRNAANARAERMAVLQEAQINYNQKLTEQTNNQAKALTQWSSYGLDLKAVTSPDYNVAFSAELPSLATQFDGYQKSSLANGIPNPDYALFQNSVTKQNAAYMNTVIGRFNLLADEYRRNNPNASPSTLMKYLRDNHNADQVYANYAQVSSMGGGELMQQLDYVPPTVDEPWYKDLASMVYEPGIEGQGGYLKGGPTAALMAGAPAVYGAVKAFGTVKEGSAAYLKAAEAAWGKPKDGGMSATEYKKTYGETKSQSGNPNKKGSTFKASSKLTKHARNTGLSQTYLGKAAKWAKGKVTPKGAKPSVKGFVKGVAPYVAPGIGRGVGEAIAGDTGGDVGQTLGTGYLLNKAAKPAGKSFVSYLASKAPSMAAKMGVMALADSPALPIGDILALGWSAVEVYKLYQAWSEEN